MTIEHRQKLRTIGRLILGYLVGFMVALLIWMALRPEPAHAAGAPYPSTTIQAAIKQGYLPAWFTSTDDVRRITFGNQNQVVYCIQDAESPARWINRTTKTQEAAWFKTGTWTPAAKTPLLPSDYAACGWPAPPPVTIGEPAYGWLVITAGQVDLKKTATKTLATPPKGTPCFAGDPLPAPSGSTDPLVGWYNVPGYGISRCRRS